MLDCCREENEFFTQLNPQPDKDEKKWVGYEKPNQILQESLTLKKVRPSFLNETSNMMICLFACEEKKLANDKGRFSEDFVDDFKKQTEFKGFYEYPTDAKRFRTKGTISENDYLVEVPDKKQDVKIRVKRPTMAANDLQQVKQIKTKQFDELAEAFKDHERLFPADQDARRFIMRVPKLVFQQFIKMLVKANLCLTRDVDFCDSYNMIEPISLSESAGLEENRKDYVLVMFERHVALDEEKSPSDYQFDEFNKSDDNPEKLEEYLNACHKTEKGHPVLVGGFYNSEKGTIEMLMKKEIDTKKPANKKYKVFPIEGN